MTKIPYDDPRCVEALELAKRTVPSGFDTYITGNSEYDRICTGTSLAVEVSCDKGHACVIWWPIVGQGTIDEHAIHRMVSYVDGYKAGFDRGRDFDAEHGDTA